MNVLSVACVTILPNDDAYGVFSFDPGSLAVALQETQGTATTVNGILIMTITLSSRDISHYYSR